MNKKYAWGAVFLVVAAYGVVAINHLVYAQSAGTVAVGQTETSGGVTEYYTGTGWTSNPPSVWAPAFGYSTTQVEQNAATLPELSQPSGGSLQCANGAASCAPTAPIGGSVTTNTNGTYTVTNAFGTASVIGSNGLCISGCGGYTGGSTVNPNPTPTTGSTVVSSCGISGFNVSGSQCTETFPNNGLGCGVCPSGSQCVIPAGGVGIQVTCTAPVKTTVQSNATPQIISGGGGCDNVGVSGYNAALGGCDYNTTCAYNTGTGVNSCVAIGTTAWNSLQTGVTCQSDSNCGEGYSCSGGSCVSNVPSSLDCGPGKEAVPTSKYVWACLATNPSCTTNSDCSSGTTCDGNVCVAQSCLAAGGAPNNLVVQSCEPELHVCQTAGLSDPVAACPQAANLWVQCPVGTAASTYPGCTTSGQTCQSADGNTYVWNGSGTPNCNLAPNLNDPYGNTSAYYNCSGSSCTLKPQYNNGTFGPTTAAIGEHCSASTPCASGTCTLGVCMATGASGAGTAGSAGGTTYTGAGSAGSAGSTGAQTGLNSTLSSAASAWSSILSAANEAATAAGQSTGSAGSAGSAGVGGSAASQTTASGSSSSCSDTAATTIASSLQTLQSLATVLTSSNVSPGVLTSIQNLINAVASVLTALAGCIH